MTATTAAERKRQQRERDRAAGMVEVIVKVPADRAGELRRVAERMRREAHANPSPAGASR